MLRAERVQEFVRVEVPFGPRDEPETSYLSYETFYGVLAPVVRAKFGAQLLRGLDAWMGGLRVLAEEREKTEGAFAPGR